MSNNNDIQYHNPDRTNPMTLERYIYVLIEDATLGGQVLDSFYNEQYAIARKETIEANEMNRVGYTGRYSIHKSRLYK